MPPFLATHFRFLHSVGLRRLCCAVILLPFVWLALAQEPRIEFIERLGTNMVTIHFDTEANRSYTLQYVDPFDTGTNGAPYSSWSNLAVIPAVPFNNHYVWPDYSTSSFRIYRLAVTP